MEFKVDFSLDLLAAQAFGLLEKNDNETSTYRHPEKTPPTGQLYTHTKQD